MFFVFCINNSRVLQQGIEDHIQDNFFLSRMLTMAKIFEELFTPTLNGLALYAWNVFSMPVVLHDELNN